MAACLVAFRGPWLGKHKALHMLSYIGNNFNHSESRYFSHGRHSQQFSSHKLRLLNPRLPCAACITTFAPAFSQKETKHHSERHPTPAEKVQHSRTRPVADLVKGRDMEWRSTQLNFRRLPKWYMELSKVRLTGLVVVTAMAGYAMAPGAFSATTLALVTSGTLLTSSAANAINQWLEVPYDSQMARTAARPLVRGHLSALHGVTFAAVCAGSGISLLYLASPLAAALGAFNLALYTAVYTPMKRVTIANTWVGAVVGGIPPLMGWAAAAGSLSPGAWLLAALLYAWQFPHFNALSWNLRKDYARAGYRIMAVTHPDLNRRVALRYSLLLAALPFVTSACDVTTWTYAVDSLPVNAYLVYLAVRFYRDRESSSARALTRFSYLQLTAGIILMLLAKRHYQQEAPAQTAVAMETADQQQRSRSLRDWCLGEHLIERGWKLNSLYMTAESIEKASKADEEAATDLSGPDREDCPGTAPLTGGSELTGACDEAEMRERSIRNAARCVESGA